MQVIKSVATMQRTTQRWQKAGRRVGLVPTMGYLHDGHLSLVRHARRRVGRRGRVVVSIYVNPTQFAPGEDLSRYPRDMKRDLALCRREGVDVVFAPDNGQMYPGADAEAFSTFVSEEALSRGMEGQSRPTHFRGVTTVVAKLFNIVQPQVAIFGAKDYQQAAVVLRMVRDLNFPLQIITAQTVREPDGLAMSSRNKFLEGDLRTRALVVSQAIRLAQATVRKASRPVPATRLKAQLRQFIDKTPAARLDYVEFFTPDTLTPQRSVSRGSHMALAVFVGKTRLIDNARV